MTNPVEIFSISHAAILDGATSAEDAALTLGRDVYGVRQGTLTPNVGSYEYQGDDGVNWLWEWVTHADLNITAGYISFDVVALITGNTVATVGSDIEIDLWTEDKANVMLPVLVRCPAKDSLGAVKRLDVILYAVQFAPLQWTGMSYKTGGEASYGGRALPSLNDETGTPFGDTKRRVGRVVSGAVI